MGVCKQRKTSETLHFLVMSTQFQAPVVLYPRIQGQLGQLTVKLNDEEKYKIWI